jgi:pimeloyl-ACP methyl ester carboxylesterase
MFVRKRLKNAAIPHNELEDYKVYLAQTLPRPASTELFIYTCFDNEMFAKVPLSHPDRLLQLKVPVHFLFGSLDWMRQGGAKEIIEANPYSEVSKIHILEAADHHMYWDQPEATAEKLLEILNLHESILQHRVESREGLLEEVGGSDQNKELLRMI